ncbi:MAG: hypothetical protein VB102_12715 [Paludibacter sp.]|nr:hypothetical protein [Paludibacter sp.]
MQAMRYEWWGFFVAGICPAELPAINFQACLTRFNCEVNLLKEM